jgi:transposase
MTSRDYIGSATLDATKRYASELNDREFALIAPHVAQKDGSGKKRTVDIIEVLNAIFYRTRTGCQWRNLPHEFPPWPAVYSYFRMWRLTGLWERLNAIFREQARRRQGRNAQPSAGIIDSQTVKTTSVGGHAATMAASVSAGGNDISSWIPSDWFCVSQCILLMSKTALPCRCCWRRPTHPFRTSSISGSIKGTPAPVRPGSRSNWAGPSRSCNIHRNREAPGHLVAI